MASQQSHSFRGIRAVLLLVLLSNASCESQNHRQFFNNRVVKYHSVPANFFTAFENCQDEYMTLMTIQDDIETELLKNIMMTLEVNSTWIAATDLVHQDEWVWTSSGKKVEKFHWGPNQPNNIDNLQHCLTVSTEYGGWNDVLCTLDFSYFCQE